MIVYSFICRAKNATILCEATTPGMEGNFAQVALQLIEALHANAALPDDTRRTFVHGAGDSSGGSSFDPEANTGVFGCSPGWALDSWFGGASVLEKENNLSQIFFHCMAQHGLIYLCVTDKAGRSSTNYGFLEDVRQQFCHNYTPSKIDNSKAYGMERTFSSQIKNQIHNYNTNPHAGAHNSTAVALNAKVEDLKNVMGSNMSVLLKRGERVDTLLDQAEDLEQQAKVFKKTAKTARQEVQAKQTKNSMMIHSFYTAIFILASLFIWAIVERIRGSSNNNNN